MCPSRSRFAAAALAGLALLAGCGSPGSISGMVSGAVGVELSLQGPAGKTQVAARDGTFSFGDLPSGTYALVPSLAGFAFEPPSRVVTVDGSAKSGQDFTAKGSPGVLDTVFGDGGVAVVNVSTSAVALQPDGRIVLVGWTAAPGIGPGNSVVHVVHVQRLLADGQPDPSFGSAGGVSTGVPPLACEGRAVAIQGDGKIVAAGACNSPGQKGTLLVARWVADGGPDGTFGSSGVALTTIGADDDGVLDQVATGVAALPDGALVVSGFFEHPYTSVVLARYRADGALDGTFGDAGTVMAQFGMDSIAEALAIQSDGGILITGAATLADAGTPMYVARYTPRGTLDPQFGAGGVSYAPAFPLGQGVLSTYATAYTLAVQPDGKLLAVGGAVGGVGNALGIEALARWTPAGEMDPTFGGFGTPPAVPIVPGTATGCPSGAAVALALQPDGRFFTAGNCQAGEGLVAGVRRWLPDGLSDRSFVADLPYPYALQNPRALALQPDGKLVVAGEGWVARYWP